MRMNAQRSLVVFVFAALMCPVFGQVSSGSVHSNLSPHILKPYTAQFKITSQQTLADGTVITRESTETDARDSQGRHMHSQTEITPQMGRDPGTFGNANDPVEGTQSTWDSRTRKARVVKLPPQDQRQGCWANEGGTFRMAWRNGGASTPPGDSLPVSALSGTTVTVSAGPTGLPADRIPRPTVVDLGTTTIEGLEVHGRRYTTTIQPGEIGNDEPIVTTRENWVSTELGIEVRSVTDDPRSGKHTRELVDVSQSEPDPTTFQPPEGYEVTIVELHKVECAGQ